MGKTGGMGAEEGGDRRRRGGTEWEEKGKERKGESRPPTVIYKSRRLCKEPVAKISACLQCVCVCVAAATSCDVDI